MAIVPGVPDPISSVGTSAANLKHAKVALADASRQPQVNLANLVVDPYIAQAGDLLYDSGSGVASTTGAYNDIASTTTGLKFTPALANPGSNYRFLPYAADVRSPAWFPHGTNYLTYPQLQRVSKTSTMDPKIEPSYYYQQHRPQVRTAAPAYCLNTTGFFKIATGNTGPTARTRATFLMVFIPHHGPGSYYPIYSSRAMSPLGFSKRVEFWYVKGHIKMVVGNHVVQTLPTFLNAYEPVILAWSWDSLGGIFTKFHNLPLVRIALHDRRSYAVTTMAKFRMGWDFNGWIGARPTTDGGSTPDWSNIADMDILEVNMWNYALNVNELANVCGLFKAAYGIGW
jgi:hypothetical protein